MNDTPAPSAHIRTVLIGLMLGMFVAAIAQTVIAPALPRITAELGALNHYSWIAASTLLASTLMIPIAGKLSDLYGRKAFYVAGILLFMLSSMVAGLARGTGLFIVARVLEGFGMGVMMPLTQAILGDLVPPRDRGKYQGLMGATYGVASIVGPLAGGWITEHFSWRWLFFMNIPLGAVALAFVLPFMRLPHTRRRARVDVAGFATLSLGLTAVLLALMWGGTKYAWTSAPVLGLGAAGGLFLTLFAFVETRAAEPVVPPHLWRRRIFTAPALATLFVAMGMFGSIYYIPVFVQGALGASVADSGMLLMPLMLATVGSNIFAGFFVTRTGRYKGMLIAGVVTMGLGCFLLTLMDRSTPYGVVVRNMILIGLGLGTGMQTFILIVQNAVDRPELGAATAAVQLFRSIGASAGTAFLGTVMNQRVAHGMAVAAGTLPALGAVAPGEVLRPERLSALPPEVLDAVRGVLAGALHHVFLVFIPIMALALVAVLLIPEIPLRRTLHAETPPPRK